MSERERKKEKEKEKRMEERELIGHVKRVGYIRNNLLVGGCGESYDGDFWISSTQSTQQLFV